MHTSTGVEKDEENARYWYRQAGVPAETGALKAEWAAIARDLIGQITLTISSPDRLVDHPARGRW